ncbi:venom carboxylesterase-6-like [Cylas formicarius]|uniref:venom carboxylesterase-6-like n=1 Tax=Cylas formicarius TaxID=197179 RepID=UPI00295853F7|nr:venom carboxylesterase-6-like [Cylas formicarius]XP_060525792.1 venom carboxylesterase-6-like [Cylas formicarius]
MNNEEVVLKVISTSNSIKLGSLFPIRYLDYERSILFISLQSFKISTKSNGDMIRLLCILFAFYGSAISQTTVDTPNGKIQGKTETTSSNYTFYSFSGIRYGRPPVGELRFKAPKAVEPWTGVYDATAEKNICFQVPGNSNTENEDCLFLHVYTPRISDTLLPVMFFIHGGGFVEGASGRNGRYGPDFFMEYDVVLVTINYRLGPFGFFSTGDDVIQGNAGLKDQTLALQWVQQNIKYFGGDPSKVTIFGQSAGSASVSYHILSPKSAGLFRAAILESGSALSPWAYQRDQRAYTFRTAALLDPKFISSNDSKQVLDFLLNATARDIDGASQQIYNLESPGNMQLQQGFYYAPVIEPDNEDAFLTTGMYEAIRDGNFNKVPVIIGMNAEECINQYNSHIKDVTDAFDNNESLLLPLNMHLVESNENRSTVIKYLQDFYSISANIDYHDQIVGTVRYLTDQCFARSIIKHAQLQAPFADTYFYIFAYDGDMGDYTGKLAGTGNVTHSEELNYIFSRTLKYSLKDNTNLSQFSQADQNTHYRLMKLWTNFAKYLNPTPDRDSLLELVDWPKVDVSNGELQYLDINKDLAVRSDPRWNAFVLWDSLYERYAVKPLDGF